MVLGVGTQGHRCRGPKVPAGVGVAGLHGRAVLLGVALLTGEILGFYEILHVQLLFFYFFQLTVDL
jgi:hypothetical protein